MNTYGPLIVLSIFFALFLTGQVLITLVYGQTKQRPTKTDTSTDTQPIVIPTPKPVQTDSTETQS